MKYQIFITNHAEHDLRDIYEYITFTLLEPETATKQLERIEAAILSLDELPERFRLFENEPWHSRGIMQMPVDNFIVFYVPNTKEKLVTVIRIMHDKKDTNIQLENI